LRCSVNNSEKDPFEKVRCFECGGSRNCGDNANSGCTRDNSSKIKKRCASGNSSGHNSCERARLENSNRSADASRK
jgi:hypothetical protein